MSTDSEISEVTTRVRRQSLTVCENCGGQGYTDGGRSACGVCLGAGVTTPELLAALHERTAYRTALDRIAKGETTIFDEAEGRDVLAWLDEEEMSQIAREALPAASAHGGGR